MSGYATITVNASSWARVTRERDEARDDCERLNRLLRHETALGQGEIDHWAALERERDEAREQNEEQARLLAMSADREEKMRDALKYIAGLDTSQGASAQQCSAVAVATEALK